MMRLVRRLAPYTVDTGLAFCVLGMMLVIAGVLTSGLFLPGVVLIGAGILKFVAVAVVAALGWMKSEA